LGIGTIGVKHLLCFGFGFSAQALAQILDSNEWKITGTSRSEEGAKAIIAQGFDGQIFTPSFTIPESVTHILSSVPPDETGDPVIQYFGDQLSARRFDWITYLSTTGVYGDHQGAWVSEETALTPNTKRGERRVSAEAAWAKFKPQIFRLAGIYGPGRNQLETVKAGTAQRIVKQGQIFSRIHVADIAGILKASIARPNQGRIYNVADDEPCPPQDVVAYAATLLGVPVPPDIAFEDAKLSAMAKSFYADSKRVSNARIKEELHYKFIYPNFRVGLRSLL
jgi:nucleoside-diphosphate-sugar epimerase